MKLVSMNIEGKKHLARVIPFLRREKPDAVCLHEVFQKDAANIGKILGMRRFFVAMTLVRGEKRGIAIFSHFPMKKKGIVYYYKAARTLQEHNLNNKRATIHQALLAVEVGAGDKKFILGNTHFTWTPNGMSDDNQRKDIKELFRVLKKFPEIILCGDFNIPRGVNDLYGEITKRYRDAVPKSYVSSLNMRLHRMGKNKKESRRMKKFMVDYIFLSKEYRATSVRLASGISDHKAVIGFIDKKKDCVV
ncbi:MAG: endonuclease/exonuclease/phosphatase family protein [Nanoarchaeota archaeon]|nr:endonuclease/exonuclease/phosphatase family protein [Nanoarchaeota archaeon]